MTDAVVLALSVLAVLLHVALGLLAQVAGSLYFSEVTDFLPCPLCWWQRIFMYPLVILLGAVALDRGLHRPGGRRLVASVLPLPVLGALTSAYRGYVEHTPGESPFCTAGVPCTIRWFTEFGYVTLPALALTAFATIGTLLLLALTRPAAADEK